MKLKTQAVLKGVVSVPHRFSCRNGFENMVCSACRNNRNMQFKRRRPGGSSRRYNKGEMKEVFLVVCIFSLPDIVLIGKGHLLPSCGEPLSGLLLVYKYHCLIVSTLCIKIINIHTIFLPLPLSFCI